MRRFQFRIIAVDKDHRDSLLHDLPVQIEIWIRKATLCRFRYNSIHSFLIQNAFQYKTFFVYRIVGDGNLDSISGAWHLVLDFPNNTRKNIFLNKSCHHCDLHRFFSSDPDDATFLYISPTSTAFLDHTFFFQNSDRMSDSLTAYPKPVTKLVFWLYPLSRLQFFRFNLFSDPSYNSFIFCWCFFHFFLLFHLIYVQIPCSPYL